MSQCPLSSMSALIVVKSQRSSSCQPSILNPQTRAVCSQPYCPRGSPQRRGRRWRQYSPRLRGIRPGREGRERGPGREGRGKQQISGSGRRRRGRVEVRARFQVRAAAPAPLFLLLLVNKASRGGKEAREEAVVVILIVDGLYSEIVLRRKGRQGHGVY
jgi:hypothetical protein